jgi:hypothetical protein
MRGVSDGSMYTWRTRPDMQALCGAHDLFDDA